FSILTVTAPSIHYPPSLHDALPILVADGDDNRLGLLAKLRPRDRARRFLRHDDPFPKVVRDSIADDRDFAAWFGYVRFVCPARRDRKSTRLNSSHGSSSYAVFCLKK